MSYVSIAAQIKALILTITEVNVVYDYNEKQLDKFPAVTISMAGHENEFNDLAANRRIFRFFVRVYVRSDSDSDAERILRIVADKVIEKIEGNVTLNGSCDFAMPTRSNPPVFLEREVPVYMLEMTVEARKRVNR